MRPHLTEAQRDLAVRYLPLARAIAKPLKAMFPVLADEFESAACLALVEAARSFLPARGVRFATFARFRIRGSLRDVCRNDRLAGLTRLGGRRPAREPLVATPDPADDHLVDAGPPVGHEFDAIDQVEGLIRQLPGRHAAACHLYFIDGLSQARIGRAIGCSQSEAARLIRGSLQILAADPRLARAA